MKKVILAVALVGTLSLGMAGCAPRTVHHLAAAAFVTAAVVGTAHAVVHHDAHRHHAHCGHARRSRNGRWVYRYDNRGEHYHRRDGAWY